LGLQTPPEYSKEQWMTLKNVSCLCDIIIFLKTTQEHYKDVIIIIKTDNEKMSTIKKYSIP